MTRLRRSDVCAPGIRRRRAGKGFVYLDADGERVTDTEVLARIHDLVIPPAWKDVWICPYPGGHIQATGIDQRSRKQYLYHPRWRERQDRKKFDAMVRFAQALPRMRKRVERDLAGDGLTERRGSLIRSSTASSTRPWMTGRPMSGSSASSNSTGSMV